MTLDERLAEIERRLSQLEADRGPTSKLSQLDVEEIRRLVATGIPKAKVARDYGVTRQTIYNLLSE